MYVVVMRLIIGNKSELTSSPILF